MQKLLLSIILLLVLAVSAMGTDITLSSFTVGNSHGYTGSNIKLRVYFTGCSGNNFLTSDNQIIQCGQVGSATGFFKEVSVTVSGNTLTIPAFVLPSTDNSSSPGVRATAVFFVNGARRDFLFANYTITATLGTPITYAQLFNYQPTALPGPPPPTYLTAAQISALIPASVPDASTTVKGKAQFATDGEVAALKAVQANDSRLPTQSENDALAGTSGAPGTANKYVTNADSRVVVVTTSGPGLAPTLSNNAASYLTGIGTFAVPDLNSLTGVLTTSRGGSGTTNTTGSNALVFNTNPSLITPFITTRATFVTDAKLVMETDQTVCGGCKVTIGIPTTFAGPWTLTLPGDDGNSGDVLQTDGAGNTSWTALASPQLVTKGGTGKTSLASNALLVGAGTSALAELAPGAAGTVVKSNGTIFTTGLLGTDSISALDTDTTLAANSDTKIPSQKAIKAYADNLALGEQLKTPVRVATTVNGTLATAYENGDTVDGVPVATSDRILIKDQTTQTENGIYTVNASGAPTRATDADTDAELLHASVLVTAGTANANTRWTNNNTTITIGVTNITFVQVAAANVYTAGLPISLTGNQFTIADGAITSAKLAGSIAASKLVGTDIATVGTITTGTWNATLIGPQYGGTGVNNVGKTITLGGNLTTSGANALTLTTTGTTNVTLPISGTLSTLAGAETLANKTLTTPLIATVYGGSAANDDLTIEGTSSATKTTSYVIIQPTGGNVGIGTTAIKNWHTTQVALQMGGGASFMADRTLLDFNLTSNAYLDGAWKYLSTATASNYFQNAGTHNWRVAPSGTIDTAISWITAMSINNAGNVGIGTASPQKPLHVISTVSTDGIAVGENNGLDLFLIGYDSTNNIGTIGSFSGGVASTLAVNPLGGNVGIGTTSPTEKLYVSGNIHATGNITCGGSCGGGGGAVTSVFGRTGAVVAATNDYTWAQINKTTSSLADLTTRNASDLSSGALNPDRLATGSGSQVLRRNSSNTTLEFFTLTALQAGLNLSDVSSPATSFANIKQAATTTATGVVELATAGENAANVVVQGNDPRVNVSRVIGEFADFGTAVSTIASTPTTLVINAVTTVSSNVTVPSTLVIEFTGAGQLSPNVSTTTTIPLKNIVAPMSKQIFAGAGSIRLTGGGEVSAHWFAGADASVKIQAADTALDTNKGTIRWEGSDNWSTTLTLNSDHILQFGPGTITATVGNNVTPIKMKSRTAVRGAGMFNTIITEPTYNAGSDGTAWLRVIYTDGGSAYPFEAEDDDVEISDLQIKGANTFGDGGTNSAIGIGNGKNATISRVFINGTKGLGITFGGFNGVTSDVITRTRDGGKVVDSLFRGVKSQNLNVVNGRNILFKNNTLYDMQTTGAVMDGETNTRWDFLENIIIEGNTIDLRNTPAGQFPNAIAITNANNTPYVGNIVINGNTVIGGKVTDSDGTVTNTSANCVITENVKDVSITNNICRRMGQAGMALHGDRFNVSGNLLEAVGGGGVLGMQLELADSSISNNLMLSRSGAVITAGSASDIIKELTAGKSFTVNTAGTTVTRTAGGVFSRYPTMQGQTITINAVAYTVSSVTSDTVLVLTTTAGTQTGVAASIPAASLFDRNTYKSNESDFTAWTGTNATNPVVLTGTNSKVISHYDRTTGRLYNGTNFLPTSSGGALGSATYPWAITGTTASVATSLTVGSGTPVTKVLSATAALDFDLTAVPSQDLTITVTGAVVGDTVSLGVPNAAVTADTVFSVWVSASDTVTVRAARVAGTPNPASGSFRATVMRF